MTTKNKADIEAIILNLLSNSHEISLQDVALASGLSKSENLFAEFYKL